MYMFQYLTTDFYALCEVMENLVGVRDKEDIASTLVHIMQKLDKAKEFLTEVIIGEVIKQGMQLGHQCHFCKNTSVVERQVL